MVNPKNLINNALSLKLYFCSKLLISGSGDIFEGNLKLILGLVWTLILHYQISMGFNIDDDDDGGAKKSGKQALLEYIQVQ